MPECENSLCSFGVVEVVPRRLIRRFQIVKVLEGMCDTAKDDESKFSPDSLESASSINLEEVRVLPLDAAHDGQSDFLNSCLKIDRKHLHKGAIPAMNFRI